MKCQFSLRFAFVWFHHDSAPATSQFSARAQHRQSGQNESDQNFAWQGFCHSQRFALPCCSSQNLDVSPGSLPMFAGPPLCQQMAAGSHQPFAEPPLARRSSHYPSPAAFVEPSRRQPTGHTSWWPQWICP